MSNRKPILELKNLVKSYGAVCALKNGGLTVYPGEVHALMGSNGAGKSTMIKIISGAQPADSGDIIINGEKVVFNNPIDAMEHGIAVVYQELSLIPHLTVSENISLANPQTLKKGRFDWNKSDELARKSLEKLGSEAAEIDVRDIAGNLRADQMQMVEIARAVGHSARLILLDEPTSSLNFEETETFFNVIKALCEKGIAVIFVSHKMNEVRQICDRITILRDGNLVVDGADMKAKSDEDIVNDMLGEKLTAENRVLRSIEEVESGEVVLSFGFDGNDTEYKVHAGEIVGLAGLSGSGRSSILRTIWGGDIRADMHFKYLGKEYKPVNPAHALANKMAFVGENRSESGLFYGQPIHETIIMAHRNTERKALINEKKEAVIFDDVVKKIQIKIPYRECSPGELSGGNQQKLLFGRWVIDDAKLILLDEPTRGVDVRTKNEIYQRIRLMAAENNAGVIVVSSELEELVLLCDKVIVMRNGQAENILYGDQISESNMMKHITVANES